MSEIATIARQDALEFRLLTLWRAALNRDDIDPGDDFFKLGGDSIQAARLFESVHREFGCRLPLSTLLRCGSVASLAAEIRRRPADLSWRSLVVLRSAGNGAPVVAVHGSGEVLFYSGLADAMDRPFYALQASPEQDGKRFTSIAEIAAAYIEELRDLRPRGPYIVAGICFGNYIALEMAQQLIMCGERVERLVIFDSAPPPIDPRIGADGRELGNLHYFFRRFVHHAKSGSLMTASRQKWQRVMNVNRARDPLHDAESARLAHNDHIAAHYHAKRFPGSIVFVRSTEFASRRSKDTQIPRWTRIAGNGLEVVKAPGTHLDLLKPPGVEALAHELEEIFRNTHRPR